MYCVCGIFALSYIIGCRSYYVKSFPSDSDRVNLNQIIYTARESDRVIIVSAGTIHSVTVKKI